MTPLILAAAAGIVMTCPAQVVDADTIRLCGQSWRLAGIDAPELDTREGRRSRDWLHEQIEGEPVTCVQRGHETSWQRVVGHCTVGGRDLGEMLIEGGWAVRWPKYDPEGLYE